MIEHFLYGTPARIKALRAALPDELTTRDISGGLVLREELGAKDDFDWTCRVFVPLQVLV